MNCLLVGANFKNKGAYLMLLAIKAQINKYFPGAKIFVSPLVGNKKEILSQGFEIFNFPLEMFGFDKRYKRNFKIGKFLKQINLNQIMKNFDIDAFNKIDVIFDISGLAFTDQWGAHPTINASSFVDFVKKKNIKYVMMPQAFGPFTLPSIIPSMKKILEMVNIVFARDEISLNHLKSLTPENDKLFLNSDITLAYHSKAENPFEQIKDNYCCIIPNIRMLRQGKTFWGEDYLEKLEEATQFILNNSNQEIFILIHDDEGYDIKIANQLIKNLNNKRVKLIEENNPEKLKAILSGSLFVISSRFHALASALSSNVPSIAIGWSHKYQMLFKDYNIENLSIDKSNNFKIDFVKSLLHKETNNEIRKLLQTKNLYFEEQNKLMWQKIDKILT